VAPRIVWRAMARLERDKDPEVMIGTIQKIMASLQRVDPIRTSSSAR
jgi:hypothetical protein